MQPHPPFSPPFPASRASRPIAMRLAVRAAVSLLVLASMLPAAASDAAVPGAEPARSKPAAVKPTAEKPAAEKPAALENPAATATEAADPIEKLRQRLAERLTSNKSTTSASGDLHLVARTAPATAATPAPAARPPIQTRIAAPGGRSVRAADAAPAEAPGGHGPWTYGGAGGPQAWADLKPEFSLCGKGQRQSPIDIRGGLAVDLDPVRFDYQQSPFSVVDNGHTVQVNVGPGNSIDLGGRRFELVQFHFHRPSEERIDGRQFEMSLHLVHKDDQGRLAVVGVLFDKGQAQPQVQKVWNALPLERHTESVSRTPLDLIALLPEDRRYITYMGSLTTPPCSEGVQWIVMRQPVTLTPEQLDIFARIYPMNARPLQSMAGRRIIQSQ